jgi:antitoxin PrlF
MYMTPPRSRLTSQGQVSIPAEIRRKLGLDAGSVVEWNEDEAGRISVRRAGRFTSEDVHQAVFAQPATSSTTVAAMDDGIRHHIKSRRARR